MDSLPLIDELSQRLTFSISNVDKINLCFDMSEKLLKARKYNSLATESSSSLFESLTLLRNVYSCTDAILTNVLTSNMAGTVSSLNEYSKSSLLNITNMVASIQTKENAINRHMKYHHKLKLSYGNLCKKVDILLHDMLDDNQQQQHSGGDADGIPSPSASTSSMLDSPGRVHDHAQPFTKMVYARKDMMEYTETLRELERSLHISVDRLNELLLDLHTEISLWTEKAVEMEERRINEEWETLMSVLTKMQSLVTQRESVMNTSTDIMESLNSERLCNVNEEEKETANTSTSDTALIAADSNVVQVDSLSVFIEDMYRLYLRSAGIDKQIQWAQEEQRLSELRAGGTETGVDDDSGVDGDAYLQAGTMKLDYIIDDEASSMASDGTFISSLLEYFKAIDDAHSKANGKDANDDAKNDDDALAAKKDNSSNVVRGLDVSHAFGILDTNLTKAWNNIDSLLGCFNTIQTLMMGYNHDVNTYEKSMTRVLGQDLMQSDVLIQNGNDSDSNIHKKEGHADTTRGKKNTNNNSSSFFQSLSNAFLPSESNSFVYKLTRFESEHLQQSWLCMYQVIRSQKQLTLNQDGVSGSNTTSSSDNSKDAIYDEVSELNSIILILDTLKRDMKTPRKRMMKELDAAKRALHKSKNKLMEIQSALKDTALQMSHHIMKLNRSSKGNVEGKQSEKNDAGRPRGLSDENALSTDTSSQKEAISEESMESPTSASTSPEDVNESVKKGSSDSNESKDKEKDRNSDIIVGEDSETMEHDARSSLSYKVDTAFVKLGFQSYETIIEQKKEKIIALEKEEAVYLQRVSDEEEALKSIEAVAVQTFALLLFQYKRVTIDVGNKYLLVLRSIMNKQCGLTNQYSAICVQLANNVNKHKIKQDLQHFKDMVHTVASPQKSRSTDTRESTMEVSPHDTSRLSSTKTSSTLSSSPDRGSMDQLGDNSITGDEFPLVRLQQVKRFYFESCPFDSIHHLRDTKILSPLPAISIMNTSSSTSIFKTLAPLEQPKDVNTTTTTTFTGSNLKNGVGDAAEQILDKSSTDQQTSHCHHHHRESDTMDSETEQDLDTSFDTDDTITNKSSKYTTDLSDSDSDYRLKSDLDDSGGKLRHGMNIYSIGDAFDDSDRDSVSTSNTSSNNTSSMPKRRLSMEEASIKSLDKTARKKSASIMDSFFTIGAINGKDDNVLVKEFNLPRSQRIIIYYSCCWFPVPWQLVQGTMYLTQKYLCFRGWPEIDRKVTFRLHDVRCIEKENTALVIPNAIRFRLTNRVEYLFGSFLDRDQTFDLLQTSIEVEKHYYRIQLEEKRGQDFSDEEEEEEATTPMASKTRSDSLNNYMYTAASGITPPFSNNNNNNNNNLLDTDASTSGISTPLRIPLGNDGEGISNQNFGDIEERSTVSSSAIATHQSANGNTTTLAMSMEVEDYNTANDIDFESLFSLSGDIHLLKEDDIPQSVSALWEACWQDSAGYHDFLNDVEGDFDVEIDEWDYIPPNASTGEPDKYCAEDQAHIPFCCSRKCNYAHPRKTMLMFGPKNAKATQKQYLYLQGRGTASLNEKLKERGADDNGVAALELLRTHKSALSGVVLTVTSFDGIPMADVFKVLQYWSFEPSSTQPVSHTCVRVAYSVHYLKNSLFKSQIKTGVSSELLEQAERWITFAGRRTKIFLSNALSNRDVTEEEEGSMGAGSRPTSLRMAGSRPTSLRMARNDPFRGITNTTSNPGSRHNSFDEEDDDPSTPNPRRAVEKLAVRVGNDNNNSFLDMLNVSTSESNTMIILVCVIIFCLVNQVSMYYMYSSQIKSQEDQLNQLRSLADLLTAQLKQQGVNPEDWKHQHMMDTSITGEEEGVFDYMWSAFFPSQSVDE